MRESQAEIKAIEAQLRAIRAEPTHARSGSSRVLEPFPSRAVTPQSPPRPTYAPAHKQEQPRSVHAHPGSSQVPQAAQPQISQPLAQSRQAATGQSAQAQRHTSPQADLRSPQLPPIQNEPLSQQAYDDLAALVERLQRQSEFYIQQSRQLQPQFAQTVEQYLRRALPVLEAQVQHVNQLSAVQEAALLELKATAEKVEQDWKTLEQPSGDDLDTDRTIPPLCHYRQVAVPKIEQDEHGVYIFSTRSIDLFRAEREAALTAQALRHWAERDRAASPQPPVASGKQSWGWLKSLLVFSDTTAPQKASASQKASSMVEAASTRQPHASTRRARRTRRSSARRAKSTFAINLKEGVALILGAVMVRLVLDLLLVSFPVLWTPAVALLITPAAIAVYRTSRTPRSGFAWGYRLLFIMIGLLLGGRL